MSLGLVALRVKAKSLMEEASIIRQEEDRCRGDMRRIDRLPVKEENALARLQEIYSVEMAERLYRKYLASRGRYSSLRFHRTVEVRHEARITHLARMFLANLRYRQVEMTTRPEKKLTEADVLEIVCLIQKYGPESDERLVKQSLSSWLESPLFQPGDVVRLRRTIDEIVSHKKWTIELISDDRISVVTFRDGLPVRDTVEKERLRLV